MHITVKSLFRDTINFFKLKWSVIFVFSILSSFITLIIDNIITPNISFLSNFYESETKEYFSFLDFIKTLTLNQQKSLLLFSITRSVSLLIGNSFLLGNIIIFAKYISLKKTISLSIFNNIPNILFIYLFLLTTIITVITQLGFLLFFVPGVILLILFSLSPIILIIEKQTILNSIYSSINIIFKNIKIIGPAVIFWLFLKIIILLMFSHIKFFPEYMTFFLLSFFTNLITSTLIIYLFRFYMLLFKL